MVIIMKRKVFISPYLRLTLILMLVLVLVSGCSANADASPQSDQPQKEPEQQQEQQEQQDQGKDQANESIDSRTITDMLGREITIPHQVETVATLGSAARLLTYADCADRITGLSDLEKEVNPGMPYAYINRDYFQTLTSVSSGGASSETYEEALLMLQPDLIFTNNTDVDAMNTLQEKLQIPIVILNYDGIFDESVYQALDLIGQIMGTEDHCQMIVDNMKNWQEDLDSRTKDISPSDKPSVYCGAVSYRGAHGIDGTYGAFPPLLAINANNVVDELNTSGPLMIDKEQLLVWNPDYIFLTPNNMYLVNDDFKENPDFYNQLDAVKKGHLYSQINYNYYGTNIELAIVDAYYAGKILYPQAFEDIDFNEKSDEIFKTMLKNPYLDILNTSGNRFEALTLEENHQ